MERIIPQEILHSSRSDSVKGGTSSREKKGDHLEKSPLSFSRVYLPHESFKPTARLKTGLPGS